MRRRVEDDLDFRLHLSDVGIFFEELAPETATEGGEEVGVKGGELGKKKKNYPCKKSILRMKNEISGRKTLGANSFGILFW